jgi:hypothetical protein
MSTETDLIALHARGAARSLLLQHLLRFTP